MSLSKLSLRNAKRQAGDYLVYFISIIISAALIYAFNCLVCSGEIKQLSSTMENLPIVIVLASIVVVFIMGWLVNYTMVFMLKKRSRELGTYMLMGMENKDISGLFLRENLVIGAIALLVGTLLGNLFFQALRAAILTLFSAPYIFSFSFSLSAILLTLVYFALIYTFALMRSRKRMRKMKIYDLINFDKVNETEAVSQGKNRQKMFVASIICAIIGTLLLVTMNIYLGILGAGLIIVFLYLFFVSFSSGVPAFFEKRTALKFSKSNLLVFRSLSSKLNTMGVTMATVALLFTATLIAIGSGIVMINLFESKEEIYTSYDLFIGSYEPEADFSEYMEYIDENITVTSEHTYLLYSAQDARLMDYIVSAGEEEYYRYYDTDMIMCESDYVALRKMLGYAQVDLPDDGYIIHCMSYLEKAMKTYDEPIVMDGQSLSPAGVYSESFTQALWDGNGSGVVLVVADEIAQSYEPETKIYAAMCSEPVVGETYEALRQIRLEKRNSGSDDFDTILSIGNIQDENATIYAMLVFPLFYLAIVLMMTAATILSIQILSDVPRYRRQFKLLSKLGMSNQDMNRALRRQFSLFYTMPLLPSVLVSSFVIVAFGRASDAFVIGGAWTDLMFVAITLGVFFAIYLLYIVSSYTSFKRGILSEN